MKLKEQILTAEQAKHLQELGLDMSDAALCLASKSYVQKKDTWGCIYNEEIPLNERTWFEIKNEPNLCKVGNYDYVYTYTLQEMLDKLPDKLDQSWLYIVKYENKILYAEDYYEDDANALVYEGESLFEAAYKMLCCVVENGCLKEGE